MFEITNVILDSTDLPDTEGIQLSNVRPAWATEMDRSAGGNQLEQWWTRPSSVAVSEVDAGSMSVRLWQSLIVAEVDGETRIRLEPALVVVGVHAFTLDHAAALRGALTELLEAAGR